MDDLQVLRNKIDKIDEDILALFVNRFSLVKKIGEYKKKQNMPIFNKKREDEKINILSKSAKKIGVSERFIQTIWRSIFAESYKLEI